MNAEPRPLLIDCPPGTLVEKFSQGRWQDVVIKERHIEYAYIQGRMYFWTCGGVQYRSSPSHALGVWIEKTPGNHTHITSSEHIRCR